MKSIIIWGSLFVLNFVCFYFLIPPEVYRAGSFFIPLLGGFFSLVFLLQAIKFLREDIDTRKKAIRYRRLFDLCGILSVLLGGLFYYHNYSRLKNELAENGIKTRGIITGGFTEDRGKYGVLYSISVTYITQQGDTVQAREDVDMELFNNSWEGKRVNLLYSPGRPKNIEILPDEKEK